MQWSLLGCLALKVWSSSSVFQTQSPKCWIITPYLHSWLPEKTSLICRLFKDTVHVKCDEMTITNTATEWKKMIIPIFLFLRKQWKTCSCLGINEIGGNNCSEYFHPIIFIFYATFKQFNFLEWFPFPTKTLLSNKIKN